ncbi:GDP-mannose 4,6-dehydratase [Dyadobacter tibetensis]|uniref:GDP-mannose 4,6-dehydratase n=1 Tax=Dyadobacter tibetensis TaxID=1211851 RepID=UPI000472D250|nr:GDP-mannose 4,6-dehydratase [Dyadobacter tibetensis]
MTKPTAIIAGITGQDGAYLSKLLLDNGYQVVGLLRSYINNALRGLRYLKIDDKVILEECDLLDITQLINVIKKYQPTEIYNLSAQSSVSISFKQPIGTVQYNTLSVLNILEAIRLTDTKLKFYQASSSEMYGMVNDLPITENSIMHPLSPYAVSKAAAHWLCINYRESYDLFICCGILFNHESYLRSDNFFIKKIIREAIQIKQGKQEILRVGNIDISRDFGFAPRYVEAMFLMMQHSVPDDYLVCSGQSISLRAIINHVFDQLHIDKNKIVEDPTLFRPTDIEDIYGSNVKANEVLNWSYDHHFFEILDLLIEEEMQNS